ncbi:hypothetical protein [Dysgonomonas sp. HGC4]|uniref:hypothetical protein n=1 Tax=Dysgonomonas sp. HGC4 TaxID=1658009 RepID=UPI000680F643|nr:hypothetical protein [Dysgonomonas sp. HGC4]MBD8349354.1 hypothetical protein [Dysgonomonas sp. HGC4]
MNKSRTANVAGRKSVLSVKANTVNTGKKFNPKDAEEITPLAVDQPTEEKLQETAAETSVSTQENQTQEVATPENNEIAATQAETKEVTTHQEEEKRVPTIEELKVCANNLFSLQEKHTNLLKKRADLSKFTISHDDSNAIIIIRDANGLEFKSPSRRTIAKVLESWDADFKDAQITVEEKMKEIFFGAA